VGKDERCEGVYVMYIFNFKVTSALSLMLNVCVLSIVTHTRSNTILFKQTWPSLEIDRVSVHLKMNPPLWNVIALQSYRGHNAQ